MLSFMGRDKLTLEKIENPSIRKATYSKRKDSILKKAKELSILCDTDVAVMMFSPSGRLNSFASNGRIEDIFIRYLGKPDESEQRPITYEKFLTQRLRQLKYEGEMLEKMATIEAFEEKLAKIIQQRQQATAKMRYYNPDVEGMDTVLQAGLHENYLRSAIKDIQLSKANLLGKQIVPHTSDNSEVAAVRIDNIEASMANQSADVDQTRYILSKKPGHEGTSLPTGPHLTLNFIKAQKNWRMIGKRAFKS